MVVGLGWYDRAQWQRLTEVVEDRSELDDTYEEWKHGALDTMQMMERQGHKIVKVPVDVEALVAWCQERSLPINGKTRSEYVSFVLRHGHEDTEA